jgi:beta-galactosidase/beta-glucuronidase
MNKNKALVLLVSLLIPAALYGQQWQPAHLQLATPWSKDVSPDNALPEYPRPQMVRGDWQNLNGLWDYAVTDSAIHHPANWDGKILVPYPIESALSGVEKPFMPKQRLFYERTVEINKKSGKRYLLHFGAVDYETKVFVNGKEAGTHNGGYQEFTFDITDLVKSGSNKILVNVLDPTEFGNNPKGKQILHPAGIVYTATSGIWQTVWLETVPKAYIENLYMTPNVDGGYLELTANSNMSTGYTIEAVAGDGSVVKGNANEPLQLKINNAHLWSPDDPFLYDLTVKLLYNGKVVDKVGSYFGMRKIEIKKDQQGFDRIYLNNKYTFNLGVLDQGFWPDGIYTAPTDAALKFDISAIKSMGFNTIRKHIKIEPARWYYYCDKLGMMVWQDMPYPANQSPGGKAEFETESAANILQLHNYPCITTWVLFNESWNKYNEANFAAWMKKADPSRLLNANTGEVYNKNSPKDIADKSVNDDFTDVHDYAAPSLPPRVPGKAMSLGEWGGIRVITPGHQWDASKGWGYVQYDAAGFARKYELLTKHLKLLEEEGLTAAIYTQPFNVETEENGLITYDREVFKIPVEKIKKINEIMFSPDDL